MILKSDIREQNELKASMVVTPECGLFRIVGCCCSDTLAEQRLDLVGGHLEVLDDVEETGSCEHLFVIGEVGADDGRLHRMDDVELVEPYNRFVYSVPPPFG